MFIKSFAKDDQGAVTVDYVVLTAAIVGIGLAVLNVVNSGTEGAAVAIDESLGQAMGGSGGGSAPASLTPFSGQKLPGGSITQAFDGTGGGHLNVNDTQVAFSSTGQTANGWGWFDSNNQLLAEYEPDTGLVAFY